MYTQIMERKIALKMVMMPKEANYLGVIFGGHILGLIDLAAAQAAREVSPKRYFTKIVKEVDFKAPVNVGDLVTFYTEVSKIGNTSITIKVSAEVYRGIELEQAIHLTETEVVLVAVDEKGRPVKVCG